MIWDTLAFNPDNMRYSYFGVACLQRYYRGKKKLSISRDSAESAFSNTNFIQGNLALEVRRAVPLQFSNKQSCWGSGSRDSENDASSIFEKAIMLGVWLSRFGERCLFYF
ncbi:hypothetical protein ACFX2F_043546 [Malus domestica]